MVKEEQLIIPVTIPGRETTVSIGIASREATIVTRETGLADALVTLHKSPGQSKLIQRVWWKFLKRSSAVRCGPEKTR